MLTVPPTKAEAEGYIAPYIQNNIVFTWCFNFLGFASEVDVFIAGTVLQYLTFKKHIVAALALKVYTENHPAIARGPPFKHPLLNFIWLLLLAIEQKETIAAFSTLVEKYKPSLQRYNFRTLI